MSNANPADRDTPAPPTRARLLGLGLLMLPALLGVTGCADEVTDCDMSVEPVTCQRDQRFTLAATQIVVDELETSTEAGDAGEDTARVEAQVTLADKPSGPLRAQLHVVETLTDEDLVIDSDRTLATPGQQTLAWDFSGHGYAKRIQFNRIPPNVFLVFADGDRQVTVNVMTVHYS